MMFLLKLTKKKHPVGGILGSTQGDRSSLLEIAVNKTHAREQNRNSAPSPEVQASAYGTQMAKYFTMNQPPHVAIDSAVSVVRPQLAITRLIARSGIPERTASIPSEKAYVVSECRSVLSAG